MLDTSQLMGQRGLGPQLKGLKGAEGTPVSRPLSSASVPQHCTFFPLHSILSNKVLFPEPLSQKEVGGRGEGIPGERLEVDSSRAERDIPNPPTAGLVTPWPFGPPE